MAEKEKKKISVEDLAKLEEQYCRDKYIHFCCLICRMRCDRQYTFWSGCMPCTEYCEKFDISPFWENLFKLMNGEVEVN